MLPRGVVLRLVVNQHQESAEPAHVAVQPVDLLGHGVGGADQPQVVRHVLDGDGLVGHLVVVLEDLHQVELTEQRQQVVVPNAPQHAVQRQVAGFLVGVRDIHVPNQAPVGARRCPAGALRPLLDGFPVAAAIIVVQGQAHGDEAALAGDHQRGRLVADGRHSDRRMRLLVGAQEELQGAVHGLRNVHVPVLALVLERPVVLPDLQDDVQGFARHVPVFAVVAIDVEQRPVAGQAAGAHAEQEAPLGDVVEVCHSVRQLGGMVERQQVRAGAQLDALRLHQRLGDQQVGRRNGLPGRGEMFSDPGFVKAQLVAQGQVFQVPLVGVVDVPFRRMRRHHKQSVLHGSSLNRLRPATTPASDPVGCRTIA